VALIAFATLLAVGAGTASADPYWQPVTITGKFHCSAAWHPTYTVSMQACVVVNGTATQAVGIVTNHSGPAVSIAAPHLELYVNGSLTYDRYCLSSTLNAPYTRACFGPTQQRPCSAVMYSWVYFNIAGYGQWIQSPRRQMCT